uniref:Uncharacterized protein n=1 Tax=Triticum urartu TaxID=4572 RepID=A0A8R7Q8E6_TRIUA
MALSVAAHDPKTTERTERGKKGSAAAMASGGGLMMKKELGETHDVLHFGANDSVRGDLAPAHPVQATIHKEAKFWDEKKFGTEAIYGSAFNIRRDLDAQILSRKYFSAKAIPLHVATRSK